jgi:hypothetical protein
VSESSTEEDEMTRHLIVTYVHDDEYDDDGQLVRQGWVEEADYGRATQEQIEASDADANGQGFILVDMDDERAVVIPGRQVGRTATAYVTA